MIPMLDPDRFFDPIPKQKEIALALYSSVQNLPILSPHSHVDPAIFSGSHPGFGNAAEVLVQPDHYILRLLYSQGIPYEQILDRDNPRKVWRLFADNFYIFRGTPSGIWFTSVLETVFNVEEKLNGQSAERIYDQIKTCFSSEAFTPQAMMKKLNISVIATTDAATDSLEHHQAIHRNYPELRIIPTFRPDALINIQKPDWQTQIRNLSAISKIDVINFKTFIQALEKQRSFFKSLGATASDISPASIRTGWLTPTEVEAVFQRAIHGKSSSEDAINFSAHMLCELARMSVEDGMVLQIHPFVYRNHNPNVMTQFGADKGFDIPLRVEFTQNLHALLESFGNNPALTLILFTLDESAYSRELAPLAGSYPAVKIGPPWWFHDSWNGMHRYFDQVMETAGIYNTVGFNDDTRVFLSIPARHDIWRRASANWLAGLVIRGIIDHRDAEIMAIDLAIGLAKRVYHL
ncbi:MAG: glucuronate isomerase [Chloroflexi bacterium HGW-Chloroflexi-8]|nr:MAG: glucuronate isomerase [Chloroflexi bacterium HGW-Chloroflexi-8]